MRNKKESTKWLGTYGVSALNARTGSGKNLLGCFCDAM